MIKIDVFVQDKKWIKYIANPNKYIQSKKKFLHNSLKPIKIKKFNCSILLTGNKEIRGLNKKFRKKNKTTDVLSFPFYNVKDLKNLKTKNVYLGDIILNFYKIKKKNFEENFNKLWIHGFLHLLGHKHKKKSDYKKMYELEKLIFNKIKKN